MKKILFLIPLLLICFVGFSQGSDDYVITNKDSIEVDESPKHAFGFNLGSTTGLGLSYRFFPNKFGFQLTGIPVFLGNGGMFLSTGLSLMYKVKESRRIDLFGYLGNHFIYTTGTGSSNYSHQIGLGAGINMHVWIDVLDISIQLGYGAYDVNHSPISMLAGEFGFFYRF